MAPQARDPGGLLECYPPSLISQAHLQLSAALADGCQMPPLSSSLPSTILVDSHLDVCAASWPPPSSQPPPPTHTSWQPEGAFPNGSSHTALPLSPSRAHLEESPSSSAGPVRPPERPHLHPAFHSPPQGPTHLRPLEHPSLLTPSLTSSFRLHRLFLREDQPDPRPRRTPLLSKGKKKKKKVLFFKSISLLVIHLDCICPPDTFPERLLCASHPGTQPELTASGKDSSRQRNEHRPKCQAQTRSRGGRGFGGA